MKKSFSEFKGYIKDKSVAVVGIGISNIPLIEFLVKLGARVTAFDKKEKNLLGNEVDKFEKMGVGLELGEGYLDRLQGFDVIFKTPSMRADMKELVAAKNAGSYITSEMEEFIKYCPAKVYGVTGSDGKTTSTTIIYNLLKEQGFKTWVGGNIGTPLFNKIEEIKSEDRVVVELSSFQLMTMTVSPEVAIITNLSPNHLDVHKDMEEYIEAKKVIFKYQDSDSILVLNEDNEITASMKGQQKGILRTFSLEKTEGVESYLKDGALYIRGHKVADMDEMKVQGIHNVANFLDTFAATEDEVSIESMRKVFKTFAGVEHRNEFVREKDGVSYYNDSMASSPTRTLAGLKAAPKPVILICCGYDKHIPFEPLAYEGYGKIKELILMGATREKIKAAFDKLEQEKGIHVNIYMVNSMEEAVLKAKSLAVKGDIVTLSPACASFDMFKNFEERGNKFKEIVNAL